MLADVTILAARDPENGLLYVVAIIVLAVIGAIVEKVKKNAAEAELKRRPPVLPDARPPVGRAGSPGSVPPPVPPTVALPPGADRWPPVALPSPVPQRRPTGVPRPRRRDEQPPVPRRPQPVRAPAAPAASLELIPAGPVATGTQHAPSETERQIESQFLAQGGALRPVESLAQIRARQQKQAAPGVDLAALGKPTLADLRRAIIFNEVLSPPLAMRQGE
jgi:hypothetical protein